MIEIEAQCAAKIRQLRKKKGLTLKECEELSEGRFKAVVMGSYERGARAVSLERLQEIADFYSVPIRYFFGEHEKIPQERTLTFDLRRIRNSSYTEASLNRVEVILNHFIKLRNDWNGEILTIRESDTQLLPAACEDPEIIAKLDFHGYLFTSKN